MILGHSLSYVVLVKHIGAKGGPPSSSPLQTRAYRILNTVVFTNLLHKNRLNITKSSKFQWSN